MNSAISIPVKQCRDTFSQLKVFGVTLNLHLIRAIEYLMLERTSGDLLVQSPCREQGRLEQVYEDCVPSGSEHPQGWRLLNQPGQSLLQCLILTARHLTAWVSAGVCAGVGSRGVPMTPCQSFFLCLSGFCCISVCVCWPVTGHHWQESGSVFFSSQRQIFRQTD